MSRKGIFAYNETERKQLEEISHLYFSPPAASERPPISEPRREPAPEKAARPVRAFHVCCVAARGDSGLASRFLYNIALLLRLTGDRVLFLCSHETYENRFGFCFRPDRERAVRMASGPVADGVVGPMGICLLDSRCLARMPSGPARTRASPVRTAESTSLGPEVSFDYLLSDRVPTSPALALVPGLFLVFVTPETPRNAFGEWELKDWGGDPNGTRRGGIVVAAVREPLEVSTLYTWWQERLEQLFPGRYRWEDYGVCPEERGGRSGGAVSGMGVLESPTGWQARCHLETVSRIRRLRSTSGFAGTPLETAGRLNPAD